MDSISADSVAANQLGAEGRQEYADVVGAQQHTSGEVSSEAIGPGNRNACILQINSFEERVQRDMRVEAGSASNRRTCDGEERGQWCPGEGGKSHVEPDNIGIYFADRFEQAGGSAERVEAPAALNVESVEFFAGTHLVCEEGQINEGILAKSGGEMEAVLVEISATRWERSYQTDFEAFGLPGRHKSSLMSRDNLVHKLVHPRGKNLRKRGFDPEKPAKVAGAASGRGFGG